MSRKSDRTMLVIPDTHYTNHEQGGHDPQAESCMLQAIKLVKPDIVVHIGDVGEWESVSPWRFKRQRRPPLQYVLDDLGEEAVHVNAGLDRIDAACKAAGVKQKHLIEGNHEVWVDNLIEENHHLKKDWSVQNLLKLKDRGWKYHPYGKYVPFGGSTSTTADTTRE